MPNSKLVTLGQLASSFETAKQYIDQQDSALSEQIAAVIKDVEGIVATGGEANILEGIKVNGNTLPITDKIAELIIAAGTENGTINVNGAAIAIAGLKNLAFLDKISEDEFSDSLKASFAALATNADLTALEVRVTTAEGKIAVLESAGFQTAADVQAAIAAANHLKYSIVETLPEASAADANTWYLLYNEESKHYDIYGLIEGKLRIIDDTTIDLTGYSTTDAMKAWVAQEIAALNVDQYATDTEMAAAVERISALETALGNFYTKTETEEYVSGQFEAFQTDVIDPITTSITALGNRVTALEEGMDGYATDEEAQTVAASEAASAIEAAKATDEAVATAVDGVFTSAN